MENIKKRIIERHIISSKMGRFNDNFPYKSAIAVRDALLVGMTSKKIHEEIISQYVSTTAQVMDALGLRTKSYDKQYKAGFNKFLNQILYI